jgi:hypothetical protein
LRVNRKREEAREQALHDAAIRRAMLSEQRLLRAASTAPANGEKEEDRPSRDEPATATATPSLEPPLLPYPPEQVASPKPLGKSNGDTGEPIAARGKPNGKTPLTVQPSLTSWLPGE